jgi:transcriptional regulator with XRE-family HTH domain
MSSRDALQSLLWAEVRSSGFRQVEIAAQAGISEKHLSQIMRGTIVGTLDNLDRILAACGRRLVLGTAPLTDATTESPDAR